LKLAKSFEKLIFLGWSSKLAVKKQIKPMSARHPAHSFDHHVITSHTSLFTMSCYMFLSKCTVRQNNTFSYMLLPPISVACNHTLLVHIVMKLVCLKLVSTCCDVLQCYNNVV